MKAYTIPTSQQKNRSRNLKGVIVKASSTKQAKKKAGTAEQKYTRNTVSLSESNTHVSTVGELRKSDINGKDPMCFRSYKFVDV